MNLHSWFLIAMAGACTAPWTPGTTIGGTTPAAPRPSHPPATEAQWVAAEGQATLAAKRAGGEQLAAPVRIRERGFLSKHHVAVAAGRCYHAAIAWSFDAELETSLSFDPGTNQSLAGASRRFEAPGGTVDFCADHDGGATIGLTAISRAGMLASAELLEYAVVVGSAKEAVAARTARRASEAKQARQARESEEASQRLGAQIDRDRASRKCHDCYTSYSLCRAGDCRRAFDLCAHDNSYTDLAEHPENKPCGTP